MTYNVLMGTLNPTHSLTHSLWRSVRKFWSLATHLSRSPKVTATHTDWKTRHEGQIFQTDLLNNTLPFDL